MSSYATIFSSAPIPATLQPFAAAWDFSAAPHLSRTWTAYFPATPNSHAQLFLYQSLSIPHFEISARLFFSTPNFPVQTLFYIKRHQSSFRPLLLYNNPFSTASLSPHSFQRFLSSPLWQSTLEQELKTHLQMEKLCAQTLAHIRQFCAFGAPLLPERYLPPPFQIGAAHWLLTKYINPEAVSTTILKGLSNTTFNDKAYPFLLHLEHTLPFTAPFNQIVPIPQPNPTEQYIPTHPSFTPLFNQLNDIGRLSLLC